MHKQPTKTIFKILSKQGLLLTTHSTNARNGSPCLPSPTDLGLGTGLGLSLLDTTFDRGRILVSCTPTVQLTGLAGYEFPAALEDFEGPVLALDLFSPLFSSLSLLSVFGGGLGNTPLDMPGLVGVLSGSICCGGMQQPSRLTLLNDAGELSRLSVASCCLGTS